MDGSRPVWWAQGVVPLVTRALAEDLGTGDVTSALVVPAEARAHGELRVKAAGVVSGLATAREVFRQIDPELAFAERAADGDGVVAGTCIAEVSGRARSILAGERTALNFLQRLSGVATLTRRFVDAVAGTGVAILDTRKTTPGLRLLEKEAVRHGGGVNHRFGLYDAVMIKDNHIVAAGGLGEVLAKLTTASRTWAGPVIVEVDSFPGVCEAAIPQVDRLLLDNFSPAQVHEAVVLLAAFESATGRRPQVEVSGGVTLDNIAAYAQPGVDFISIGALTHSAPALDISLDLTPGA